jgi:hypothetical protein
MRNSKSKLSHAFFWIQQNELFQQQKRETHGGNMSREEACKNRPVEIIRKRKKHTKQDWNIKEAFCISISNFS